ncbi:MAG: FAD-binding protein [Chloroflexi bacterium]|nr:FAD-binding protein [Chloroflexota bacterium]
MLPVGILKQLQAIVGREHVLTSPEELVCYSYDSTPVVSTPDAVVVPGSTQEISEIMRLANRERVPVVPRGSGTDLSGGTVPLRKGIVLSTARLNKILEIDEQNLTATLQPAVITGQLQAAVERLGLFYPPDPSSLGVSTIGGNVAEGAGGARCLKYGTTKDYVLGLEVVLASGDLIRTGGKTVKNVSGYNLTQLFVGSEGTLGVVTEVTVRLIPLPEAKQTLLAVFGDLDDAARTVSAIIAAKIVPTTLELIDGTSIKKIEAYRSLGYPLDAEAVLLIEVDGSEVEVQRQTGRVEDIVRANGARELRVARNGDEADHLWLGRRVSFAALARSKPTAVTEDVTVPRAKVPALVRRLKELARKYDLDVAIMGHAGDGNMHPLVMTDFRDKDEMARMNKFFDETFRITLELGGTLTGEHGIGLLKAPYMKMQFGKEGVEAMRAIKLALDPNNILNPGKIIPDGSDETEPR